MSKLNRVLSVGAFALSVVAVGVSCYNLNLTKQHLETINVTLAKTQADKDTSLESIAAEMKKEVEVAEKSLKDSYDSMRKEIFGEVDKKLKDVEIKSDIKHQIGEQIDNVASKMKDSANGLLQDLSDAINPSLKKAEDKAADVIEATSESEKK